MIYLIDRVAYELLPLLVDGICAQKIASKDYPVIRSKEVRTEPTCVSILFVRTAVP